jgi:hypothetical protein
MALPRGCEAVPWRDLTGLIEVSREGGIMRIIGLACVAMGISGAALYLESASAQTAGAAAMQGADLSGVWNGSAVPGAGEYRGYAFSEELPPMTDWAKARYAESKPTFGPTSVSVADTNDPVYQCFPPGTPRVYFHPFPMEIIQTPGRVIMLFEYDHLVRQIFTDGRGHRDDLAPSWMGDSIGHWEGDTLVVETTNFNDKTWVDRRGVPHSEQMRVVERIRRIDPETLQIDIAVEDPVAFMAPWTGQRRYRTVDWNIEEFMCMDNVSFLNFEQEVIEFEDDGSSQ